VLNAVAMGFMIPNEIAMCLVFFNLCLVFLITLGSPLWDGYRTSKFLSVPYHFMYGNHFLSGSGWTKLGDAQGFMVPIEVALLTLQSVSLPYENSSNFI
jgi:hypothetical protein